MYRLQALANEQATTIKELVREIRQKDLRVKEHEERRADDVEEMKLLNYTIDRLRHAIVDMSNFRLGPLDPDDPYHEQRRG